MPKKRIHKDRSTDTGIGHKTRNRVECKCMLHCNGSKWVDPRTFEKHRQEMERFQVITSEPQSAFQLRSIMNSLIDHQHQREEVSEKLKKKARICQVLIILMMMSPIRSQ